MSVRAKALLVGTDGTPPLRDLLQTHGIRSQALDLDHAASSKDLRDADVAVISVDWARIAEQRQQVVELVNLLASHNIATLVVGVPDDVSFSGPLIDHVPASASPADVEARLGTFARYAPMVRRLDRELSHLQRLGKRLNHHFADVDQEMRLAGRLQRDFLPRQLPDLPPLSFDVLYRPASWVSGDVFDVFRIDERHVGLFVGDAVGHGIAAGLLTMFVRNALRSKRLGSGDYEVVEPAEALAGLHETLVRQSLPNCWFVTASYLVIDLTCLDVQFARGGHPYALHVSADGTIRELQAGGGLLGVADVGGDFEQGQVSLHAGDKVIVYSDGVESAFIHSRDMTTFVPTFQPDLTEWVRLPAGQFLERLGDHLDRQEGSLHPSDDMTVLTVEVAG